MILNFDSTYPERKRRIWGWIWDGENATRGLYYLIITSFTSSKCQINISLSKFERKRSPSIDDRRKKERRRWGAKMQQTWRGERKGERGDEKEKKEKDENARGNSLQTFPLTLKHTHHRDISSSFAGETRDSWLVNAWKSRKNRPTRRYYGSRKGREGGRGGLMKKSCAIVRGRWRGTIDLLWFFFFFFCGFLFIEVKNIGKKVSIRLFNILIRWFILKIIYN